MDGWEQDDRADGYWLLLVDLAAEGRRIYEAHLFDYGKCGKWPRKGGLLDSIEGVGAICRKMMVPEVRRAKGKAVRVKF